MGSLTTHLIASRLAAILGVPGVVPGFTLSAPSRGKRDSMGKLLYGDTTYVLDDRVLAHLQVVVSMKLRRRENFFVSWRNRSDFGGGRQAVWIDNGLHLAFQYDGSVIPSVNRQWVETLAVSAGTNFGLQLTDEEGNLLNRPRPEPVIEDA